MIGEEELLEISEKTVKQALKSGAEQALVNTFFWDRALTRYANSTIHQNVAYRNGGVTIKVAVNKNHLGMLRIKSLDEKKIKEAVKQAIKIAKTVPSNRDFKEFPKPEKWSPLKEAFDEETAFCTPDYRAEKVKEAISTAHEKASIVKAAAGYLASGYVSFAVSSSTGISAWSKISLAYMKTTVISEGNGTEGFGAEQTYSRKIETINPTEIADVAAERSVKSVNPIRVEPKEYEVVLAPSAVETIFFYLGYIGFSATRYHEGTSFVKYNLNKQVFDEKLNVKDDAKEDKTFFATPIDGEGVPKKTLTLIENGKVSEKSICYDNLSATKEGKKSTGHALPPVARFFEEFPIPINIYVFPGNASLEEMVSETKHGLFITTFHYTNPVEPTKAILTGLTRDGTFLIKNGEIAEAVKNLRYTDSMLSALKKIPMIGKELKTFETATVPAIKLNKLRFVSEALH